MLLLHISYLSSTQVSLYFSVLLICFLLSLGICAHINFSFYIYTYVCIWTCVCVYSVWVHCMCECGIMNLWVSERIRLRKLQRKSLYSSGKVSEKYCKSPWECRNKCQVGSARRLRELRKGVSKTVAWARFLWKKKLCKSNKMKNIYAVGIVFV